MCHFNQAIYYGPYKTVIRTLQRSVQLCRSKHNNDIGPCAAEHRGDISARRQQHQRLPARRQRAGERADAFSCCEICAWNSENLVLILVLDGMKIIWYIAGWTRS